VRKERYEMDKGKKKEGKGIRIEQSNEMNGNGIREKKQKHVNV
jgi:hypothetical protein